MLARLLLAAFLAVSALAQPSTAPASALFQQVDEMVNSLSEITGWTVRKKVPAKMLGKDTFRHYVESRMKESSSHDQLRAEELTLKMLGFVPQDFNLAAETVDLVSEQAAAFYDYNKKRLFILDSTTDTTEQRVALVHELAHALADQHHPLGKYLRKGSPDDDASTARQAVMEGQATWLTWAYVAKRNGGKAEVPKTLIDQLTKPASADSSEFPVFSSAPLYLRESLVFPYNEGLKFQDAVFHKLGREGFDAVFERAPLSTQQILHPAEYFAEKKPLEPQPPALETAFTKEGDKNAAKNAEKRAKQFRVLAEGSLGELDFQLLLRQFVGEKEGIEAANHWRGGALRLYEHKREKYPVLAFASEWETPESARRFFELYQRVMKGKWKKMNRGALTHTGTHAGTNSILTGSGDSGGFRLTLSGSKVESIEGLRVVGWLEKN